MRLDQLDKNKYHYVRLFYQDNKIEIEYLFNNWWVKGKISSGYKIKELEVAEIYTRETNPEYYL